MLKINLMGCGLSKESLHNTSAQLIFLLSTIPLNLQMNTLQFFTKKIPPFEVQIYMVWIISQIELECTRGARQCTMPTHSNTSNTSLMHCRSSSAHGVLHCGYTPNILQRYCRWTWELIEVVEYFFVTNYRALHPGFQYYTVLENRVLIFHN